MQQPDVILVPDAPPGGFLARLRGSFHDFLVEAIVRQERLDTAREIAAAIRKAAPEHGPCTDRPHCWKCGQESGMREAAKTALRIGAGR